jgi:hypothetical protein
MKTIRYAERQLKEVEDMKLLLRQLIRNDDDSTFSRFKRGVFNSIGGISKIVFGTMDSEDASCYTDKISNMEKNNWISSSFLKNE